MLLVLGAVGMGAAYMGFDHVQSRIDRYLYPEKGDTFQVDLSVQSFQNGGMLGTGPGQGIIKMDLPDAHADFIFAVAAEEMGLMAVLVLYVAQWESVAVARGLPTTLFLSTPARFPAMYTLVAIPNAHAMLSPPD